VGQVCAVLEDKSRKQPPPNRAYPAPSCPPLRRVREVLDGDADQGLRFYGYRKDHLSECGNVMVTANPPLPTLEI
jgi:hypothetical protein